MNDARTLREGQDVGAAGMAAGQGIDLATTARAKLAPCPHDEGDPSQHNSGQDQGGGLGKDSDGSGWGRHGLSLSGHAAS